MTKVTDRLPVFLPSSSLKRKTLPFPRTKLFSEPALPGLLLHIALRASSPRLLELVLRTNGRFAASFSTALKATSVSFLLLLPLVHTSGSPSPSLFTLVSYSPMPVRFWKTYKVLHSHVRPGVSPLLFFITYYVEEANFGAALLRANQPKSPQLCFPTCQEAP